MSFSQQPAAGWLLGEASLGTARAHPMISLEASVILSHRYGPLVEWHVAERSCGRHKIQREGLGALCRPTRLTGIAANQGDAMAPPLKVEFRTRPQSDRHALPVPKFLRR